MAVTQNSTTVVGTGTGFVANARVGDAFLGPDGRWYEVTNIASDTALSILPAYLGATANGGIYALAPMQGYVKQSADALRALVNKFGGVLAVLGTDASPAGVRSALGLGAVSTESVVPVAKGGTGGTSQAEARSGLGLGSVATESTVPVTKGGTGGTTQAAARSGLGLGTAAVAIIGTAPGQVPVVGNFGLGDSSINNGSWNNTLRTGFSSYAGAATGGPSFNGGNWFANGIDIVYGTDPSVKTQLALRVNSADFAMRSLNMNLASASNWVYFYNTGNTTRASDGTLKAI